MFMQHLYLSYMYPVDMLFLKRVRIYPAHSMHDLAACGLQV